uniref:FHA domain protein n=1 Tax=Candidatus Kentrum sp. DK TaxID=2126562 RepID=A0A450TDQ8_9GAMM|nr:MAG: FHA domain protein [Candidatus Kentron sp. DK]
MSRLTLEMLGDIPGNQAPKVDFGPGGGAIGRDADQDWQLVDESVSPRHARVFFYESNFYVVHEGGPDGSFIGSREGLPLALGVPYPLASGDVLFLGECRILVTISGEEDPAYEPPMAPAILEQDRSASDDNGNGSTTMAKGDKSTLLAGAELPRSQEPAGPPSEGERAHDLRMAFARGLGLADGQEQLLDPAAMELLGLITRKGIEKSMALMSNLNALRGTLFREGKTDVAAHGNNPLGIDLGVVEVILLALSAGKHHFIPLPEAIDEACDEINGLLATLTGSVDLGLQEILGHLHPDVIENRPKGKKGHFPWVEKSTWKRYRQVYEELTTGDEARNVFATGVRKYHRNRQKNA